MEFTNQPDPDEIYQAGETPGPVDRFIDFALRVGGILGLAYIPGRFTKQNLLASSAHLVTSVLEGLNKRSISLLGSHLTGTKISRPGLVQSLRELSELRAGPFANPFLVGSGAQTLSTLARTSLREHYLTPKPGFLSTGLSRITVGQVLAAPQSWVGRIGQEGITTLQEALREGLITGQHFLDRGLYQTATGAIRDIRGIGSYGARLIASGTGQGPISSFFGLPQVLASLSGQSAGFQQIGRNFGGRQTLGNFFIGGEVWGLTGQGRFEKISGATKLKLYQAGDVLHQAAAMRRGEAVATKFENLGIVNRTLGKIGLGTHYAVRRPFIAKWVLDPVRRLHALATGEAIIATKPYRTVKGSGLAEATLGGQFPEAFVQPGLHQITKNLEWWKGDVFAQQTVGLRQLPFGTRLATVFGFSSRAAVVSREAFAAKASLSTGAPAGRGSLTISDLFINPHPPGGIQSLEQTLGNAPDVQAILQKAKEGYGRLTGVGYLSDINRAAYYASEGGLKRAKDFSNYLVLRLGNLASESLAGISFKPSKSFLANAGRMLIGLPVLYEMARQVGMLADYTTERLTGISPIEAGAWLYTRGRLAQQYMRQALGIQQGAAWAEQNFPGSVESGASLLARSALIPGAAFFSFASRGKLGVGAAVAGGLFAAFGGVAPGQAPSELAEEYRGERRVPVRKGAHWFMGYQPFLGGAISHFEPSWFSQLTTHARDRALYGSREAYFAQQNVFGVPLPTPWNLFGLRNVLDPYALERLQYFDQPSVKSSGLFDEFPIVGPFLSDTLGAIIKPRTTLHRPEVEIARQQASQLVSDVRQSPRASYLLGLPTMAATLQRPRSQGELLTRLEYYAQVAAAPTGIYAFVLSQFGITLKRSPYEVAESGSLTSVARTLAESNIGGAFGQCFVAGTKITTNQGYKNIECIEVGDIVLSGNGSWKRVKQRINLGLANDLVRFKIGTIYQTLIATTKHRIPVLRRNHGDINNFKVIDMEAKDICINDYVVVPIPTTAVEQEVFFDLALHTDRASTNTFIYNRGSKDFAECYELIESQGLSRKDLRNLGYADATAKEALSAYRSNRVTRFARYVKLDNKLSWLLGWYAAEGFIGANGRISFGLHEDEAPIAHELGRYLKDTFGAHAYEIRSAGGKGIVLRAQCIPAAILCSKLCGCGAANKNIPPEVLYGPLPIAKEFLKSIINGDGWFNSNKNAAGFTSKSAVLVRQVFELALRFGAIGVVVTDYLEQSNGLYPQGTPRKPTIRNYVQWFNGQADLLIGELIDHPCPEKSRICGKSFIHSGNLFVKVRSVEQLAIEAPVYDLEIEDLHYYVANQILVHNSELIRRFVLSDEATYAKLGNRINPIRNTAQTWLPGSAAEVRGDETSSVDFHTGQSWTKIPAGELRLPGRGYEALSPLHSRTPGVYDFVDQFLVLSDVAPFSKSFAGAAQQVRRYWQSISPEWQARIHRANEEREARLPVNQFGGWSAAAVTAGMNEGSGGLLAAAQKGWRAATDTFSAIPWIGTKLGPPRDPLETYRRNVVYGDTFADWNRPYESIIRPGLYDVARSSPWMGAVKGAALGGITAIPGAAFMLPFNLLSSPISPIMGAIGGFTLASTRGALTGTLEDGFIPPHVRKEREVTQHLDVLQYFRNRSLAMRAEEVGNNTLAKYFNKEATQTMIASEGNIRALKMSMPRHERAFFDAFLGAPPSLHKNILEAVPDYMKEGLVKSWSGTDRETFRDFQATDQAALNYLQTASIPEPSWAGWHPDISWDAVKIKLIQGGIGGVSDNVHRFGYFPAQEHEVTARYPNIRMRAPRWIGVPNHHALRLKMLRTYDPDSAVKNYVDYSSMNTAVPYFSRVDISTDSREMLVGYLDSAMRRGR